MGKRRVKRGGFDTDDTTDKDTLSFTDNSELNNGYIEYTDTDTDTDIDTNTNDNILDEDDENDPYYLMGNIDYNVNYAPYGGSKKSRRKSKKSRRKGKKSTRKVKKSKKRVTKRRRFYGGQPALPPSNWRMTPTIVIEETYKK